MDTFTRLRRCFPLEKGQSLLWTSTRRCPVFWRASLSFERNRTFRTHRSYRWKYRRQWIIKEQRLIAKGNAGTNGLFISRDSSKKHDHRQKCIMQGEEITMNQSANDELFIWYIVMYNFPCCCCFFLFFCLNKRLERKIFERNERLKQLSHNNGSVITHIRNASLWQRRDVKRTQVMRATVQSRLWMHRLRMWRDAWVSFCVGLRLFNFGD